MAGEVRALEDVLGLERDLLAAGEIEHACRAYVNLIWDLLEDRHFASGLQTLSFEVAKREERVLYLSAPLTFRRNPLRRGPIHMNIGLRGRIQAFFGEGTDPRGLSFARRMDVLCENAPVLPLPGQIKE